MALPPISDYGAFVHQLRTLARVYTPDWLCDFLPGLTEHSLKQFLSGDGRLPRADRQAVDLLYSVTRVADLEPSETYLARVKRARRYAEKARASEAAWRDVG